MEVLGAGCLSDTDKRRTNEKMLSAAVSIVEFSTLDERRPEREKIGVARVRTR
jgi:hypothetical protein